MEEASISGPEGENHESVINVALIEQRHVASWNPQKIIHRGGSKGVPHTDFVNLLEPFVIKTELHTLSKMGISFNKTGSGIRSGFGGLQYRVLAQMGIVSAGETLIYKFIMSKSKRRKCWIYFQSDWQRWTSHKWNVEHVFV